MEKKKAARTSSKKTDPSLKLAKLVSKGADNRKAEDIEIIDVKGSSSVTDYIVICGANSAPHFGAIADGIDEILDSNEIQYPRWEGRKDSNWLVLDMFDVVVHVLGKEERSKYGVEELWSRKGIVYHL